MVLDLFKFFFNVGVGRVQWRRFIQRSEGGIGITILVFTSTSILLVLVGLISNIRYGLEQNSQEKVEKHKVTEEHHGDEEISWRKVPLIRDYKDHHFIPVLTSQDDEHSDQGSVSVTKTVSRDLTSVI